MIDDADVPLLFALLVASAVFAAPRLDVILQMAGASALIGGVGHLAYGAVRAVWRSRNPLVRAAPLLLAALLLGYRLLPAPRP